MNTYIKRPCGLCEKLISANGLSMTSHMMAHVRRGHIKMYHWQGQKLYYGNNEKSSDAVSVSFYY